MASNDELPSRVPVPTSAVADGQRRVARLVRAGSPQWVLLQVVRDVLSPAWAPASSALRLVSQVRDPGVLRQARALLRLAPGERITLIQARALATLNLAITHLDDARIDDPAGPGSSPDQPPS